MYAYMVNTNGAAAKVMSVVRSGKKVRPGMNIWLPHRIRTTYRMNIFRSRKECC